MDLCKLGLLRCLLAQKVRFQLFFKSCNGLGISHDPWDTIPIRIPQAIRNAEAIARFKVNCDTVIDKT